MHFLAAYCRVMKPLVIAMEVLQGEKTTYLGHLIPTILGLKSKLEKCTDKLVAPLVKALSAGIDKRFAAVLVDPDHLIASMLVPQFKMNFLQEDMRLDMKRKVISYVKQVKTEHEAFSAPATGEGAHNNTDTTSDTGLDRDDEDDIFSFMNSPYQQPSVGCAITKEVEEFFASKANSITSVNDYPLVAKAFQKANSTLPSSATVERLFSVAGLILTPRRCKMLDNMFDKMVFLRCRSNYTAK